MVTVVIADCLYAAKKAVAGRVSLGDGRLRKRAFHEFMNAVIDAMTPAAESLDQFLGFLRSNINVSHCVLLFVMPAPSRKGIKITPVCLSTACS